MLRRLRRNVTACNKHKTVTGRHHLDDGDDDVHYYVRLPVVYHVQQTFRRIDAVLQQRLHYNKLSPSLLEFLHLAGQTYAKRMPHGYPPACIKSETSEPNLSKY